MSEHYGNSIVHTNPLPEAELRYLLSQHVAGVMDLTRFAGEVTYLYNQPRTLVDEETGESYECYESAWKLTVSA